MIALSRLAYMVCPCSSVHFTHVVIIGFLELASAPSGQNCNASSMHDPIAVDKNWITALLCQQYYRHSQPPFVSGRSISGVWRPYNTNWEAPTLVGGLSTFWPPQLAASKSLQSSQAQNDPNANAQSAPRSASRLWGFGFSSPVFGSG